MWKYEAECLCLAASAYALFIAICFFVSFFVGFGTVARVLLPVDWVVRAPLPLPCGTFAWNRHSGPSLHAQSLLMPCKHVESAVHLIHVLKH